MGGAQEAPSCAAPRAPAGARHARRLPCRSCRRGEGGRCVERAVLAPGAEAAAAPWRGRRAASAASASAAASAAHAPASAAAAPQRLAPCKFYLALAAPLDAPGGAAQSPAALCGALRSRSGRGSGGRRGCRRKRRRSAAAQSPVGGAHAGGSGGWKRGGRVEVPAPPRQPQHAAPRRAKALARNVCRETFTVITTFFFT